jgi:hypothetical protein
MQGKTAMPRDEMEAADGCHDGWLDAAGLDARVAELERELPHLQIRHVGVFAFANAWAERHDALLALAPPEARADLAQRLLRIGIRWGVAPGARMTTQFPALPPLPARRRDAA